MSDDDDRDPPLGADEARVADWAAEGVAALGRHLAAHAAFAAYLRERDVLHSEDGDRDPDA